MVEDNSHECIYFEEGVCGHPLLVGTENWPGEVSARYCRNCLYRNPFEDPMENAEYVPDCY